MTSNTPLPTSLQNTHKMGGTESKDLEPENRHRLVSPSDVGIVYKSPSIHPFPLKGKNKNKRKQKKNGNHGKAEMSSATAQGSTVVPKKSLSTSDLRDCKTVA